MWPPLPYLPAHACIHFTLGGREFSPELLTHLQQVSQQQPTPSRNHLAREACAALGWYQSDGRPAVSSAKVALRQLHKRGLLTLPGRSRRSGGHRLRPSGQALPPLARIFHSGVGWSEVFANKIKAQTAFWCHWPLRQGVERWPFHPAPATGLAATVSAAAPSVSRPGPAAPTEPARRPLIQGPPPRATEHTHTGGAAVPATESPALFIHISLAFF
jgi:hypothetical protein